MTTDDSRKPPHPVDSAGLVLPDGSWPGVPGSAGMLDTVRRFCNTVNREVGAEAWRTTTELDRWIAREHGLRGRSTTGELADLRQLREAVWASIDQRSNDPLARELDRRAQPDVERALVAAFAIGESGSLSLVGRGGPVADVEARVLLAVLHAQHDGTWVRLKTCAHCRWVFHDTSKNRSGRWCSMTACGDREKAKAYRRRASGARGRNGSEGIR